MLTVVGLAIPVALYFWIVIRYSVNAVIGDQWDDLVVIGHSYTHFFDLSSLWAQHNENRIFFPNLVVLVLAHTAHFNVRIEEFLSAALLAASLSFIIWSHKRRSPETPWLYYSPVLILGFSIVQYENTLWGFQMAWYLVMFSLTAGILLLDRPRLTIPVFVGAIAAGVVASFSSLQGLLIWPAGLLLLLYRRRDRNYLIFWGIATVLSASLYFYHFDSNAVPERHFVLQHPFDAVKFYLFLLGDIVGLAVPLHGSSNGGQFAVLLFGMVIFLAAGWTLVVYGRRAQPDGGSPIGIVLICVGLLFAVIVTLGRAFFGYFGAAQSRYTTFALLVPIGIYLAVLQRPSPASKQMTIAGESSDNASDGGPRTSRSLTIVRWVLAAIIVIQVVFGLSHSRQGIEQTYAGKQAAARVLRNIDHEPNIQIFYHLTIARPPAFVRRQARMAQIHHLTVFSGSSHSH